MLGGRGVEVGLKGMTKEKGNKCIKMDSRIESTRGIFFSLLVMRVFEFLG